MSEKLKPTLGEILSGLSKDWKFKLPPLNRNSGETQVLARNHLPSGRRTFSADRQNRASKPKPKSSKK